MGLQPPLDKAELNTIAEFLYAAVQAARQGVTVTTKGTGWEIKADRYDNQPTMRLVTRRLRREDGLRMQDELSRRLITNSVLTAGDEPDLHVIIIGG